MVNINKLSYLKAKIGIYFRVERFKINKRKSKLMDYYKILRLYTVYIEDSLMFFCKFPKYFWVE